MFEVLMREHALQKIKVESLPKTRNDTLKKRKRGEDDNASDQASPLVSSCIVEKVRGHTSFLTFATLIPKLTT